MADLPAGYRWASVDDARLLAELVNIAGEGLPLYVWTRIAKPGQSPWAVGRERARRESGQFSWRNAVVRDDGGVVAGCLIGCALGESPEPANYEAMPALFVPLQQLEDRAPGTWYINVLATYPEHRGRGFGTQMLVIAEQLARETGKPGLSLIVADSNTGARRLYERQGFSEHSRRPMVKDGWESPGMEWVLMVRYF